MKKLTAPLCLTGLFILLIFLSTPEGCLYGSNTDWLSQHVALAETIRTACLEQNTLLPSILPLGGGSNGFQFAYYGFLRPDVVIGCLLPSVPMYQILIACSLTGYLASVLLFFLWLKRQSLPEFDAFLGSVLFLTASCFFHTHRQLMFINYMPFLMLALLAIQKNPRRMPPLLPLWMLFLCLHSFYYAPACFIVLGCYWFSLSGKSFFRPWFFSCFLSGCMAAALLLPTGLSILEHRRASSAADAGFLTFFPNLNSLLYSAYGVGVTMLVLYLLILGLSIQKYRAGSALFLIIFTWGGISYLLNATLYARAKILIPFLPLLLSHAARLLSELRFGRQRFRLWPFPVLLLIALQYRGKSSWKLIAADLILLFLLILLLGYGCSLKKNQKTYLRKPVMQKAVFLCFLIVPFFSFLRAASKEDFVTKEKFASALQTPDITIYSESLYRYDSLTQPMTKGNLDASSHRNKSSMYSSVYSGDYSRVYYDLLKTPVQINNRLAILSAPNPFLLHFMSVRYIETSPSQVPDGYRVLWKNDDLAIAENKHVLPAAYLSSDTLSESQFEKLHGWEQAEALTRYTVVPDSGEIPLAWGSHLVKYEPQWIARKVPSTVRITRSEDTPRDIKLDVAKDSSIALTVKEPLRNQLLLLTFEVENHTGKAVVITVNDEKNKLSAPSAPYPNGNSRFHYQLLTTSEKGLRTLRISLSKGSYTLKNIRFALLDASVFSEKQWTAVEALPVGKNEFLACRANAPEDTWFVTSIPLQKGMRLLVDGKETELVTVNKAFAGARLSAGEHEIHLLFQPPGKDLGLAISAVGLLLWLLWIIRRNSSTIQ